MAGRTDTRDALREKHSPADSVIMVRPRTESEIAEFLSPDVSVIRIDARHLLTRDVERDDFHCARCVRRLPVGSDAHVLGGDVDALYCSKLCVDLELERRREQIASENQQRSRAPLTPRERRDNSAYELLIWRLEGREYRLFHGPFEGVTVPVVGTVLRWLWRGHVYRQGRRKARHEMRSRSGAELRRLTVGDLF